MFMFHTTLAVLFIALIASVALFIWSSREQGSGSGLGKVTGIVVAIIVLFNIVCTTYCGIKLWKEGYFSHMPMKMMMNEQKTPPAAH